MKENVNDIFEEEIQRRAYEYYNKVYRQYLYENEYIQEDFKIRAKRVITGVLTIVIMAGLIYAAYMIPYTHDMLEELVESNEVLKIIFGIFF